MTDPKQDVRQQFEAEMRKMAYLFTRDGDNYRELSMTFAWRGYQAALQSPAVRELLEKTRALVLAGKRFRNTVVETRGVSGMDGHDAAITNAESALRTLGAGHVE